MIRPKKLSLRSCLTLQRFSKELDDIAPLAYEEDDRDEKERANGVHVPRQDYGAVTYALDVERLFDDNGVGAVTREERAPQMMARVLRGVPSRKILVKKPVVTRERRMGVDGNRRGERESTRPLMMTLSRIMDISALVVFREKADET